MTVFGYQKGSSYTENHCLIRHSVNMTLLPIPKGVIITGEVSIFTKSITFKWHFISGLLLGPLAVPGEGRALPWAALSVGNGHVQRKMQDGLQGEHCLPDAEVQGDHGGQRLYFVEFDLIVPQSARFWLGSCKLGHKWQSSWARLCNFKKSLQNVLGVPDMISTLEIEAFCLF